MYGTRSNGVSRVNHYLMPNILYIKGSPDESAEMWREAFAWRVPIDDFTHRSFNVVRLKSAKMMATMTKRVITFGSLQPRSSK